MLTLKSKNSSVATNFLYINNKTPQKTFSAPQYDSKIRFRSKCVKGKMKKKTLTSGKVLAFFYLMKINSPSVFASIISLTLQLMILALTNGNFVNICSPFVFQAPLARPLLLERLST